jgi:hypothetical protein
LQPPEGMLLFEDEPCLLALLASKLCPLEPPLSPALSHPSLTPLLALSGTDRD